MSAARFDIHCPVDGCDWKSENWDGANPDTPKQASTVLTLHLVNRHGWTQQQIVEFYADTREGSLFDKCIKVRKA
jgi:hypothetical protein